MKLSTAESYSDSDASEKLINEIFDGDFDPGEFVILSQSAQIYIQVVGEYDGPFRLEYREGSWENHFYTSVDSKLQVKEAFLKYFNQDQTWKSEFNWQKLALSSGKPWWKFW